MIYHIKLYIEQLATSSKGMHNFSIPSRKSTSTIVVIVIIHIKFGFK
jgi:hypothetical protein